jgi:hypothetical protein
VILLVYEAEVGRKRARDLLGPRLVAEYELEKVNNSKVPYGCLFGLHLTYRPTLYCAGKMVGSGRRNSALAHERRSSAPVSLKRACNRSVTTGFRGRSEFVPNRPGQKSKKRRETRRLRASQALRLSGAGEGIRTLDPNLGNGSGSFSPPQVVARHNTKNPDASSAYLDRPAAGATLEKPRISGHLLPPCFPGHAAPAWGSKSARPRAPPLPQAIDHEKEIATTGAPRCRN